MKNDARRLRAGEPAADGSLPEAWIAPPDLRELRELVRHRDRLTKANSSVKAGMRGLLAKHNIALPVVRPESLRGGQLLDAVDLPGAPTRTDSPPSAG